MEVKSAPSAGLCANRLLPKTAQLRRGNWGLRRAMAVVLLWLDATVRRVQRIAWFPKDIRQMQNRSVWMLPVLRFRGSPSPRGWGVPCGIERYKPTFTGSSQVSVRHSRTHFTCS